MTQDEAFERLNVIVDLIPPGSSNRPGTKIKATHITIHNTANHARTADALLHARYIKGADARARKVSWHFTVDDQRCVKHLPTTEKGWHAGPGNSQSIGIEVCENEGIDAEAAVERASLLTAVLMFALHIPSECIVPHQFWTGKDCPHIILRTAGGFNAFRQRAAAFLAQLEAAPAGVAPAAAVVPEGRPGVLDAMGSALTMLIDHPVVAPAMDTGRGYMLATTPPEVADERMAELERLVGRLMLENEQLRRALATLEDVTLEVS